MSEEDTPKESDPIPLVDRRRRGWTDELEAALEEQLDQHAKRITARLETFIRGALVAFAVIGLIAAGSLVAFGVLLREQSHTSQEIQNQRRDSILRGCVDQNDRHDKTLQQLQIVADQAARANPKQAKQIQQSVKANVTIIEALVPKQNCAALVERSVEGN